MGIANLGGSTTVSIAQPTLQRTLTSGTSVSDLPTGKEITAFIIGGGAGGAKTGWPGTTTGGASGGGSGSIVQYTFYLPTSRTITYSIGAGGAGSTVGTSGSSGMGGTTTFDGIGAHGGIQAVNDSSGPGGWGGGGGGGGGGNGGNNGGAGGTYGNNGVSAAQQQSYGGTAGVGRVWDLQRECPPVWSYMSMSTAGTTMQFWSNGTIPQVGDIILPGGRLSATTSFNITDQGVSNYGLNQIKFSTGYTTHPNTSANVTLERSWASAAGGPGSFISGWYLWVRTERSYLSKLDWLINAGITLPGGGGGGAGGSSGASGGAGGGTGGAGGANNVGGSSGTVPGGGGGGGGGTGTNGNQGNGGTGGAGAVYLFWA